MHPFIPMVFPLGQRGVIRLRERLTWGLFSCCRVFCRTLKIWSSKWGRFMWDSLQVVRFRDANNKIERTRWPRSPLFWRCFAVHVWFGDNNSCGNFRDHRVILWLCLARGSLQKNTQWSIILWPSFANPNIWITCTNCGNCRNPGNLVNAKVARI